MTTAPNTDRYAIIGNPIKHSRSPFIHRYFAEQTGERIDYQPMLTALDGFTSTVSEFIAEGGRGLNVTLPFKIQAAELCHSLSGRAQAAGAVNTLIVLADEQLHGDNTDGTGLLRDMEINHGVLVRGKTVLLLGAGGAARGALHALLEAGCQTLTIANRSSDKAIALAHMGGACCRGVALDALPQQSFDIIINSTSASLQGEVLPLAKIHCQNAQLAYDMMYQAKPTTFMQLAADYGCEKTADGLGMLIEQAAESFFLWRGKRPPTHELPSVLRNQL